VENNLVTTTIQYRPDGDILEDIWSAFQAEDTLRAIDLQDVAVTAEEGHVFLNGYITKDLHYQRMEAIAHLVPGVWAVHNHLITDQSLILRVSQSLARDERLRPLVLPIYSTHGWIALGGQVPNREYQQAAQIAAAQVSTVRGVIALSRVMGEAADEAQRAIQPAIGARVYTRNGLEGWVSQVVIRPVNRLVTHAVVRLNPREHGRPAMGEFLVAVEAMDRVRAEEIILKRDAPSLKGFPVLLSGDFPIAPLTWEPPFPYSVGRVRWPREEMVCGEMSNRAQRADALSSEKMNILEQNASR
jgi:osmotically-inducible protein OsmY